MTRRGVPSPQSLLVACADEPSSLSIGVQALMSLALYETDVGAAAAARLQACLPCLQVLGLLDEGGDE